MSYPTTQALVLGTWDPVSRKMSLINSPIPLPPMKTDPRGVSHHTMTITLGIIGILVMAVSGYGRILPTPAKLQRVIEEQRRAGTDPED